MPQGGGEIIQSFLVGLGFEIDESSLAVFNKSIKSAALRVTALYGSVNALAGGLVYAFSKISEGFEQMGYEYHIIAPAINKAIVLRQELLKAYGAAGINIRKTIVDSIHLNMSLTKTRFAFEAIYKSVASKFFPLLTKQSDAFRKKLYENMPKIISVLTRFVQLVFKAFEVLTILGIRLWGILGRVYDIFVSLDKATDGWSTIILGVVAAWKLLNLEFLATPLGMIIAGLVAILALYDDFKTWQEGGKSLFDWSSFLPVIKEATELIDILIDTYRALVDVVLDVVLAFMRLFNGDDQGFIYAMIDALKDLANVFGGLFDTIKSGFSVLGALGGWASGLMGGGSGQANMGPPTMNLQNPLGSSVTNGGNQVNATFQTDVNISGSPNAASTAGLYSAEQSRVNQDNMRYLRKVNQ